MLLFVVMADLVSASTLRELKFKLSIDESEVLVSYIISVSLKIERLKKKNLTFSLARYFS
jgi:hypothetical protein